MKRRHLLLLLLLVAIPAWCKVSAMHTVDTTCIRIDEHRLRSGAAFVRTALISLPGVDLVRDACPRYFKGDDLAFAARAFDDGSWPVLGPAAVEELHSDSVYWIRFDLEVSPTMAMIPVDLTICTQGAMQVFLNGALIEQFGALPRPGSPGIERAAFIPRRTLRIHFLGDGQHESIAVRTVYTPIILPGMASGSDPFTASLHLPEVTEQMARVENSTTLQYGVYLGVNLIILLLASVIYSRNRRDLSWLMLGLLSFFQALVALSNVPPKAALGLSLEVVTWISFTNMLVYVLALFSLVLTMRAMFDKIHARSLVLFGAVSLAMIIASYVPYLIPSLFGRLEGWFTVFFFYEVARQAWRAVRKKVYGSWIIGIGALLFLLNGVFVEQIYNILGLEMGRWMRIFMRFSYYLNMPLTIAIYLAVRSAHHTMLLARQRDELDQEVKERTSELRKEKELSDELLLNILPQEVAEELKAKGSAEAVQIDQVTVLFTDFQGFTAMSEVVTPKQLVKDLHECFSAFDHICQKRGLEKIKTIGDAYMAAGGLPTPNTTHATDVINAALEMRDFVAEGKARKIAADLPYFEIRIGIHTGPVVAGIVGVKKFQYDIWGDTVNTASRMESSGEVGQVNISEATYALVKDARKGEEEHNARPVTRQHETPLAFTFTPRGKVQAKGKGEMEMYFVHDSTAA